jgi:MFS family permease
MIHSWAVENFQKPLKKFGDSNVEVPNVGSKPLLTLPFYFGNFIFSLGSQTFSIGLIAFMKVAGYSLWRNGFVIGAMQAAKMIATLLWGETADRIPSKKVVIWTELASILIAPLLA